MCNSNFCMSRGCTFYRGPIKLADLDPGPYTPQISLNLVKKRMNNTDYQAKESNKEKSSYKMSREVKFVNKRKQSVQENITPNNLMDSNTAESSSKSQTKLNTNFEAKISRYNAYGFGMFKPSWMQRYMNNGITFAFICSSVNFLTGAITNGALRVSITSLENRYKMSASEVGLIVSMYDIAGLLSILPVSYFGGKGHKPRWIGFGIMIQGIGLFVFSLIHLFGSNFKFDSIKIQPESLLCVEDNMTVYNETSCISSLASDENNQNNIKYAFWLAQILNGVGSTPLTVLAIVYMNENINSNTYSLCLGLYFLSTLLGPAAGFFLGVIFLDKFVDQSISMPIDITPQDRNWVGAWWIPFSIFGPLVFFLGIPLLGFPKKLPFLAKKEHKRALEMLSQKSKQNLSLDSEINRRQLCCVENGEQNVTENNENRDHSQDKKPKHLHFCHKFLKWDIWKIVLNKKYMLFLLSACAAANVIQGFLSFGPKYAEAAFGTSSSGAAKLFGAVGVPAASLGLISGALLMSSSRFSGNIAVKSCFVVYFFSTFPHMAFFLDCGDHQFASNGLSNNKLLTIGSEDFSSCMFQCKCNNYIYNPVCGNDGFSYYSPCHAGCTRYTTNNTEVF